MNSRPSDNRQPPPKSVHCDRCRVPKQYIGTRQFHEGTRWGVLGDLGELFVNKQSFDIYCCPKCGSVEFFVDGVGQQMRPPEPQ